MLMVSKDNSRDVGEKKGEKRPFTSDHGVCLLLFIVLHIHDYKLDVEMTSPANSPVCPLCIKALPK